MKLHPQKFLLGIRKANGWPAGGTGGLLARERKGGAAAVMMVAAGASLPIQKLYRVFLWLESRAMGNDKQCTAHSHLTSITSVCFNYFAYSSRRNLWLWKRVGQKTPEFNIHGLKGVPIHVKFLTNLRNS